MGLFDKFKKKKDSDKPEAKTEALAISGKPKAGVKDEANKVEPAKKSKPKAAESKKTEVKQAAKKTEAKPAKVKKSGNQKDFEYLPGSKIIIRPVVSEKSAHLADQNKYVFAVSPKTNKVEIKKAVLSIYGVEPLSVNIVALKGKKKGFGCIQGSRKDWKKAVVTLKKGDTIEVYEGV